jgi:hypothetical protein
MQVNEYLKRYGLALVVEGWAHVTASDADRERVLSSLLSAELYEGDEGRVCVVPSATVDALAKRICEGDSMSDPWDETEEDMRDGWRESARSIIRMVVGKFEEAELIGEVEYGPDFDACGDIKAIVACYALNDGDRVAKLKERT